MDDQILQIVKKHQLVTAFEIKGKGESDNALAIKKQLSELINQHGDFSPDEVNRIFSLITETSLLLAQRIDNYGNEFEMFILRGEQKRRYEQLKKSNPEEAKSFYNRLFEQHKQGELLQKRKRKNAGASRTLTQQQREHWDNWDGDLSEKRERTRFIKQMVAIGLASDPSKVRANIRRWEGGK